MNLDGQLQEIIEELLAHGISLDLATKEFEKKYIVGAVKRSSGNLGRAASSLGIHRNTLHSEHPPSARTRPRLGFDLGTQEEVGARRRAPSGARPSPAEPRPAGPAG